MVECKDRGLSTARAVLGVLSYIAESKRGVSAREVADRLQKSLSTAYHLLASLEAEGFIARVGRAGHYELVAGKPGAPQPTPPATSPLRSSTTLYSGTDVSDAVPPDLQHVLEAAMRQTFALTGRRTSIGVFADGGVDMVRDLGRQGLPRMGNLEKPLIRASAHALAVGKILLAGFDEVEFDHWVAEYGLRSFTPSTIVDSVALRRELVVVRERGLATDCGEYDAEFGTLAVAVADATGRAVAAIAVTATRHQFDVEQDKLRTAMAEVAHELNNARIEQL